MTDGKFSSRTTLTGAQIEELAVVGYRPFTGETDRRALPDTDQCQQALADVLWGVVNVFHHKVSRLDQDLDRNEVAQRDSIAIQDGSEIRSVEVEQLTAEGISLIERRNTFKAIRDMAAEHNAVQAGSL